MVLDEQTIPARSAKRRGAAGFRKPCTNRYHRFRFARHVPYLGCSQVRDLGSVTVRWRLASKLIIPSNWNTGRFCNHRR
jgi:hypothetical protein